MTSREILKLEFEAKEGSFLSLLRGQLRWDWPAFRRLTSVMYDVANEVRGSETLETWIAEGFWFCDTWIRDWTGQPNFSRPQQQEHLDAVELIHDLSYLLFTGDNPYEGDTLRTKAKG